MLEAEERGYERAASEAEPHLAAMRDAAYQEAVHQASEQARLQQIPSNAPNGGGHVSEVTRVPLAKDFKLDILVCTGKEMHKGLGGGFKNWRRAFKELLEMAQNVCAATRGLRSS